MQIFPNEVLDHISSHVDEPSDLLSFALTKKALKHIIIPHQLDYRYIRCDLRRKYVWKHLCKNPTLASRVITLEIINEDPDPEETPDPEDPGDPIVPRTPVGEKERRYLRPVQKYFIPALRNMINLRTFRWLTVLLFEEVWKALHESHPNLTRLELHCGGHEYTTHRPLAPLEVWPKFHNLTSFSYTVRMFSADMNARMKRERREAFITLLHKNCPNLEELQVDIGSVHGISLQGLFRDVEWPRLKRLNTQAIILHKDHLSFFASHPRIQALCIFDSCPRKVSLTFDYTALQGLRSLELDKPPQLALPIATNLTSLTFTISSEVNLRRLSSEISGRPQEISGNHLSLIRACSNVRRLVIRSWKPHSKPLTTLLQVVPQTIQRLAYLDFANCYTDFALDGDIFEQPQDLALFERLTNLTHLGRIHIVDNDFPTNSRAEQAIMRVSSVAQNLRFVAWKSLFKTDAWTCIIRDTQGHVVTHQTVKKGKYRDDVEFNGWGGQYRGGKPMEDWPAMEGDGDALSEGGFASEREYSDYSEEIYEDYDSSELGI